MSKKYKGKYIRKIFNYKGKRYEVTGRTEIEVSEKIIKKRLELEKGAIEISNPTLDEYYNHFTDIRRNEVKESTLRSQKSQFKMISGIQMTKDVKFGQMRIKDISRRNIEDARQKLLKDGKTPQYLNIIFAHLNHVLNGAVLDETITRNPCKALKQLKRNDTPPITEDRHRALSEDETLRFFEKARENDSYYYNLFIMMIKTGMRIGEACALYPTDIDRHKGFVHVRRTIRRNEAGQYYVGDDAKTSSGQRDIPLTDDILQLIREQENRNRILFGSDSDGLIFRSVEGNILRDYTVEREIKRICKAAQVEYFTCHAFRNTYATRFMEQRPEDFKILSEILGHKDVSITLNLYTHVMTENKVKAMNNVVIKVG